MHKISLVITFLMFVDLKFCICFGLAVKLVGKLPDGTIFTEKGHDDEPFEFKTDEGNHVPSTLFL